LLSPIASSRESRRANASDDDNAAEAFTVVNVIIIMADEQRRWWPLIAVRWDSTIAPVPGGKICGEGMTTTATLPLPYDSLPSERRGAKDATTVAPPATAYSPGHIDAHAVQGLMTMTTTTTTKIPRDPSSHPNCTAASH
jgi:hypothetical protein